MRILYVGQLVYWGTCLSRMRGLRRLGHEIIPIDIEPLIFDRSRFSRILHTRFLIGRGIRLLNKNVLEKAVAERPDIVWIDKGTYIRPETLRKIKEKTNALLVHHNTDDIKYPAHKFKFYLEALDIYDAHFTSNLNNVEEMKGMTKSYVGYNELAYDDEVYQKIEADEFKQDWRSEIFFIGHWEPRTERYLRSLVQGRLPVSVRGVGWQKVDGKGLPKGVFKSGPIFGEDYVKAINAGKIGLGIVSEYNRNATAARAFEIPACGTMLLAMRTDVLETLYEDGKEAAFFDNEDELVEKASYYLNNDSERRNVAMRGRERCIANKCTWMDRVSEMLADLRSAGILLADKGDT